MLKLKVAILVTIFFISLALVQAQTPSAQVFQQRFDKYLNFKNNLNPYVIIGPKDVKFFKNAADKSAGKVELMIDYTEIKTFEYLLKYAPQDSIEAILKLKGNKKWSKKRVAELLIQYEEEPRTIKPVKPLDGKKIVIDPGHIAGNADMAFMEQKYIRFVRDSFPDLEQDSIKIQEGVLTFATASILKKMLEEQGADVVLTRGDNKTVFGITYHEWIKQRKKTTLDSLENRGDLEHTRKLKLLNLDNRGFFWEFFRDYELAARARFVNKQNPDLTIIIHYNVDEKNSPWSKPGDKNYTMVFIPGAMSSDALKTYNGKLNFLRLLLTDDLINSETLADYTVKAFEEKLNLPVANPSDATYLLENCISTNKQGVYCRNLALCKNVKSPLVYGECLYQDNKNEYLILSKKNKNYYGIQTNERVKTVADAYFSAIMKYYKK